MCLHPLFYSLTLNSLGHQPSHSKFILPHFLSTSCNGKTSILSSKLFSSPRVVIPTRLPLTAPRSSQIMQMTPGRQDDNLPFPWGHRAFQTHTQVCTIYDLSRDTEQPFFCVFNPSCFFSLTYAILKLCFKHFYIFIHSVVC